MISESRLAEWLEKETQVQTLARQDAAASAELTSRRMTNYSTRAREAIRVAHAEARRYSHDHLGQGHFLLAMAADPECTATKAMSELGMGLDRLRGTFESRMPPGEGPTPQRLRRSPDARQAMRLAKQEAEQSGSKEVGTGHLLLGILKTGKGEGFEALKELGMAYGPMREKIAQLTEQKEKMR